MTIQQHSLFVSESDHQYNTDLHSIITEITGTKKNANAVDQFLRNISLQELFSLTQEEIKAFGFTPSSAKRLYFAIKLVERTKGMKTEKRFKIRSPQDAADYMMEELSNLHQEHFVAIYLSTNNEVIKKKTIFIGTLNSCNVHPREIMREAVKCSSASFMVFHNHSGSPTPSDPDLEITSRLIQAGETIGIEMLDHIIIGQNKSYVSLKEKGYI